MAHQRADKANKGNLERKAFWLNLIADCAWHAPSSDAALSPSHTPPSLPLPFMLCLLYSRTNHHNHRTRQHSLLSHPFSLSSPLPSPPTRDVPAIPSLDVPPIPPSSTLPPSLHFSQISVRVASLQLLLRAIDCMAGAGPGSAYVEAVRVVTGFGARDRSPAVREVAAYCIRALAVAGGPGLVLSHLDTMAQICVKVSFEAPQKIPWRRYA